MTAHFRDDIAQAKPAPKDGERAGPVFSGRKARQGEIILRTPLRRAIFIAGLVGIVVLGLVAAWAMNG